VYYPCCAIWCVHSYHLWCWPIIVIHLCDLSSTICEVAKQLVATLALLNLFIHGTHVCIDLCECRVHVPETLQKQYWKQQAMVSPLILCTLLLFTKWLLVQEKVGQWLGQGLGPVHKCACVSITWSMYFLPDQYPHPNIF